MVNITLCKNEEDFLSNEPRRLTISDLTPIPGVSRLSAEYWLSMSCKLMLRNKGIEFTDEAIKVLVLDSWPKFHVSQLDAFILIFRQVEALKGIWISQNKEILQPKAPNVQKALIGELKEHLEAMMGIVRELES